MSGERCGEKAGRENQEASRAEEAKMRGGAKEPRLEGAEWETRANG